MAANYDLKLVVDADTTEAKRKLDELAAAHSSPDVQEAAQRVRDYVAPSTGRAQPAPRPQPPAPTPSGEGRAPLRPQPPVQPPVPTPSGEGRAPSRPQPPVQPPVPQPPAPHPQPAPNTPPVHTPAAQEAADRVRKWRLDPNYKPKSSNYQADDFGKKAGDVAGKAIGKAVAGFLAHEVAATIFNGLKTTGGDNRTVNQAEAGVGGALKWGTMGAMVGGPIGAAIGGVGGALMGVYQERQRQQKAVEARDQAARVADYSRERDTAVGAADSAFGRSLELAGGWRQRQEMLRARRDEIENGSGSWSIKNLKETLKGLDPESERGKAVAANLEMQKNRVAQLDRQLVDEGLAVAPSRLDPGSVADSWAKRGVQVGAQVDVAQVNEKIMGEVQSCRTLLEKIANMGTDNLHNVGAMQRAVYE